MSLRGRLTREGDEKLLNPPVCQPVETKAAIGVAPKPKEQEAQLVVSCLMGPCFNDVITFPYAADHVPQRGRLHTQWTCLLLFITLSLTNRVLKLVWLLFCPPLLPRSAASAQ